MTALDETAQTTQTTQTTPTTAVRGLRIRGVRLRSAARMSFVFFAVGYVVALGTLVVLWNLMQWLGFVGQMEEILTSSLGLDDVNISGADLLGLAVSGLAILAVFGFVATLLAFVIYNAASNVFGGLHLNTTLTRRRRAAQSR